MSVIGFLLILNPLTLAFAAVVLKGVVMSDLQVALDAVVAQLAHAKDEIVAEIGKLEAAVSAGETPDLTALKAVAQSLDDIVPDVAPADPAPVDEAPVDPVV